MAWSFVLSPGGDITPYVDIRSISRTRRLHSELKPNSNKVEFRLLFDATVYQSLISTETIGITITRDSAAYFSGYVSPNFRTKIRDGRKYIEIIAEDPTLQTLGKSITTPQSWAGYAVCNPAAPASSLVHAIAAEAGVTVGSAPTISTTIPYVVVLPDEKMTWAKLLEQILFEYSHVFYFSEAGTLIVAQGVNQGSVTTTAALAVGTNVLGEMEIEKTNEKYDDIRVKYDLVELKTGIVLFQDTTGGDGTQDANIPLAAAGDSAGKDYYPLTAKAGEVFSSWNNPNGYSVWVATSLTMDATVESGIVVSRALTNYFKKCSFAYRNTAGAEKKITKLQITGNAYVVASKNTARSSTSTAKNLYEYEAKYLFTDSAAMDLAKRLEQYYKYSDLSYKINSKTALALGEYVDVTDAVYSGISVKARVVEISDTAETDVLAYRLEGAADFSVVTIVTEGESTPGTSTPDFTDTPYFNDTPPTNNIDSLAITSADNPAGSVDVTVSFSYTQGSVPADGFLIYAKRDIETPGAINLQTDPSIFMLARNLSGSESYETTMNLPTRQAGAGSIPIHYRFGVVAFGTRRSGTVIHTGGVVELAGWIDKTFAAVITIDGYNFWDQATGELRVGNEEEYIRVAPGDDEFEIHNLPIRSYDGQGVNRRAVQIDNEALDWLDTPETSPASPEQLRARIGRLGVGGAVLLDGEFLIQSDTPKYSAITDLNSEISHYPTAICLADGSVRVAHHVYPDNGIKEYVDTGSGFSAGSTIPGTTGYYKPKYIQAQNGKLYLFVVNLSGNFYYLELVSGSWTAPALLLTGVVTGSVFSIIQRKDGIFRAMFPQGASSAVEYTFESDLSVIGNSSAGVSFMQPTYIERADGTLIIWDNSTTTFELYRRVWSGSSWGTAEVVATNVHGWRSNAILSLDGSERVFYLKTTTLEVAVRTYTNAPSAELLTGYTDKQAIAVAQKQNGETLIFSEKNASPYSLGYGKEFRYNRINTPPIGFTYIQFPGKSAPGTLWPDATWSNVSSEFAGDFFRAEGGAAAAFEWAGTISTATTTVLTFTAAHGLANGDVVISGGERREVSVVNSTTQVTVKTAFSVAPSGTLRLVQGYAIRNITGSKSSDIKDDNNTMTGAYYQTGTGTIDGNQGPIDLYRTSTFFDASRVVPTAVEVRPVNQTIRIWERIA